MIGSLFSGIGGLELGLERAGLGPVAWQVEIDEKARAVLAKHWPDVDRSVTDVRSASAESLRPVDLLCGGFPCQDVSGAGKGAGLAGARSGLWFEYHRVIAELRPTWVVVENVASGARKWLPHVRHGLRDVGYHSAAVALSAFDVGAPHLRRRVFVVAADAERIGVLEQQQRVPGRRPRAVRDPRQTVAAWYGEARATTDANGEPIGHDARNDVASRCGAVGTAADANGDGQQQPEGSQPEQWRWSRDGDGWSVEPPVHGVAYGVRGGAHRNRQLGNAVVPQCAEVIGRMIAAVRGGEPWESVFS